MRLFVPIFCILCVVASFAGCSNNKVYYLTEERFPPTPDDQEIKLYINQTKRPHMPIAFINSKSDSNLEPETKKAQLEDLKERARELGADAVINIRNLNNKVNGFTVDERVPFHSYRQGNYELSFFRGTAIKFVDEETAAKAAEEMRARGLYSLPDGKSGYMNIPEVKTKDPMKDKDLFPIPTGLGPTFN